MNRPTKNTYTLLIAALLPLALGFTFFIYFSWMKSDENIQHNTVQWTINIDDVELNSGTLGTLIGQLHNETRGERRAEELQYIIRRITTEMNATDKTTPQLLTDLLRDISVEHPDNNVRLVAYEAMRIALKNEDTPTIDSNIAEN